MSTDLRHHAVPLVRLASSEGNLMTDYYVQHSKAGTSKWSGPFELQVAEKEASTLRDAGWVAQIHLSTAEVRMAAGTHPV